MKKAAFLALIVGLVSLTNLSALGIGGTFGLSGQQLGAGLTLKLDNLPPVFGIQVAGSNDALALGFTADWWAYDGKLIDFLSLYAGPGLYINLGVGNYSYFGAGLRIPVGIHARLAKIFEPFFEWAPTIGASFTPTFAFPQFSFMNFAIGFRFWF